MQKARTIFLAVLVVFLVLEVPTRGQEKKQAEKVATEEQTAKGGAKEETVHKVVPLKYANADAVARLLGMFDTRVTADTRMKVVTVSGRASAVEDVEEAIKKLDVPPPLSKDVDLTGYILMATRQAGEAEEPPAELRDVVAQLKKVLNYQSFHLLNSAGIRTQDGEGARINGVVSGGGANEPANFDLSFDYLNIIPEGKLSIIRIHRLNFVVRGESVRKDANGNLKVGDAPPAVISTNIDVPEGQKVVVGKTAFQVPANALILVLTAKVID